MPAWSFEEVSTRLFKQWSVRMSRWETMGLLVGHSSLSLGFHCNAWDSCFYSEGRKRCGFELSGDDSESSVLAAFQLVPSGWGQPVLPGLGSVVHNTEIKSPIDFEELIIPPAPPLGGK